MMNTETVEKHLRFDGTIRAFEQPTYRTDTQHPLAAHEAMLHETPTRIPAEHARMNLEFFEQLQIATKFRDRVADDRHGPLAMRHLDSAGAYEPMHARNIRERKVAAIVDVQIQVEIVRPHMHANACGIEHVDVRLPEARQSGANESNPGEHVR